MPRLVPWLFLVLPVVLLFYSPTMSSPLRIGLVLGSTRCPSNTAGVGAHIQSLIAASHPTVIVDVIHLADSTSAGHPLPFLLSGPLPASHTLSCVPDAYPDPCVRKWSATVKSWDAALFVTPQYNMGLPAVLKNALDQLFPEWKGLPAALVTLGGRGGMALQEHGRGPFVGVGMEMVDGEGERVLITVPGEFIRGDQRVQGGEGWLVEYDGRIGAVVGRLVERAEARRGDKEREREQAEREGKGDDKA